MTQSNLIAGRLDFHQIDSAMQKLLRDNKAVIVEELAPVVEAFYAHVTRFSETANMFRDAAQMKHAKDLQMRHWALIAEGHFDDAYAESVTRIGEAHHRLGLEPSWYIGGYSHVVANLAERVARRIFARSWRRSAIDQALALQKAILKGGLLDMDLAIYVYIEAGRRQREATLRLAAEFETALHGAIESVAGAANEINGAAKDMSASAHSTQNQAVSVAAAAEEASANVRTVAVAAEELSASVREISGHTATSGEISAKAVDMAKQAMSEVEKLAEAAKQIGVIVELISGIASQTNLLALNATIEAARAGDAGRGFAVVAQEVKALAEQTAKATAGISQQISGIQATTLDSVAVIDKISDTIKSMNETVTTIAAAVVEQGAATDEIARNVSEAAQGTKDVSMNISTVSDAANDGQKAADELLTSSASLTSQAKELRGAADRFMNAIRAA